MLHLNWGPLPLINEFWLIPPISLAVSLFGPSKLPDIARSIGQASQQYKQGITEARSDLKKQVSGNSVPLTEEEKLIETAKGLDIPTEGRSIEDIAHDILNQVEN